MTVVSSQIWFLLPEAFLALTVLVGMLAAEFRSRATPKTFYTIAKIGTAAAFVATLVFHDKSISPLYGNDAYTTLFKTLTYLWGLGCFYLSVRWFLSMDCPSSRFYGLSVLNLLLLTASLSWNNLLPVFLCVEISFLLNFFLLKIENDKETAVKEGRSFLFSALFFLLTGAWGVFEIYHAAGSLDFEIVKNFLSRNSENFVLLLACAAIIVPLLFKMGIAPFHFWTAGVVDTAVLPSACFISQVPVFAYYALFIKLVLNVFLPVYGFFDEAVLIFSLMSVFIGVAGANSEGGLRRLFSYVALFNMGIVLVSLSVLTEENIYASFVYLLAYLLAMAGIYTVFFAFKSKGIYLKGLKDIAGAAETKPVSAAAMLVFLISMLGLPPMIGFLGLLSVLNTMAEQRHYWLILALLCGKLLMAYIYFRLIKIIYFDRRTTQFDRTDKGIFICLALNIVLMAAVMISPGFFLSVIRGFLS